MDRLRGVDALVFVADPGRPGVRYEVTRQALWSYALFARSKLEELAFVAEGSEAGAGEARDRLVGLLGTPHAELCRAGGFDFAAWDGPAQVPHPTVPVPPWPNLGLSRPVLELVRRRCLAGGLPSMTGKRPDAPGARLLEDARREARR